MSNDQLLHINSRLSDSPLVEMVWHSRSYAAGPFLSTASSRWEMIFSAYEGRTYVALKGPETRPTVAQCPPDGEWVGITFKHGVFMPHLPVNRLVDAGIELPEASTRSFWLHGAAWEFPTFENAESYIARLVKEEVLVRDPVVESALHAQAVDLSLRSVQRRFLRATGLTHGEVSQIDRAHVAVALLKQGVSILDTVEQAGYADQPHLTRSLKRLIGQTPAQLAPGRAAMELSFSPVTLPH